MEKPVKTYGIVLLSVLGSVMAMAMIFAVLKLHFGDILSKNDTAYSRFHAVAVSSDFEDNSDIIAEAKPDLSVTSYAVTKGNWDFDYFGQAVCNGNRLSVSNFNLGNSTLQGNQIKLEIYAVEDNNLYGNLSIDNTCANIKDHYMNVPEGYTWIRDSLYSYDDNGTTKYAKKSGHNFYQTNSTGSTTGSQLNVTARIDTRGTYYLKYIVTNAKGMRSTAYVNVIVN